MDQPVVAVRGEAVREVPPDQALVTVTVSARDKDRQTTLARLTERAARLRELLDGWTEAIERRETGVVQVHPEVRRGERVTAYVGSVATTVTVTDFPVLGELLLRLADQDQVAVSGPWWQLRPGSAADAEVRRAAIADALTRAREYAEAVGARVDRLLEIRDDQAEHGVVPMRMAAAFDTAATPALELDPQPQTVRAGVLVRVAITEPTAL